MLLFFLAFGLTWSPPRLSRPLLSIVLYALLRSILRLRFLDGSIRLPV
jgi:hypothetical protein